MFTEEEEFLLTQFIDEANGRHVNILPISTPEVKNVKR